MTICSNKQTQLTHQPAATFVYMYLITYFYLSGVGEVVYMNKQIKSRLHPWRACLRCPFVHLETQSSGTNKGPEVQARNWLWAVLIKLFESKIKFMLKLQIGQIFDYVKSDLSGVWACFQATCMPTLVRFAHTMTGRVPEFEINLKKFYNTAPDVVRKTSDAIMTNPNWRHIGCFPEAIQGFTLISDVFRSLPTWNQIFRTI